jgi:hypothetical protein
MDSFHQCWTCPSSMQDCSSRATMRGYAHCS